MTIEKLKDKLHDKIEIHVCEVEENTLIAQGMLKALGMMDEVLETAEQEQTDKSNLEKICEELAAENDDLRDQLAMRDRFKIEPCDDVVSRQAVLDGIEELKQSPWFNDDTHEAKIIRKEAVETVEDLCVKQLPPVRPQEPISEQWQELKETIIELRDNDGTGTQQEVCKFLANYMEVLEKQMQEPKTETWSIKDVADTFKKHGLIREQEPKTGHWIKDDITERSKSAYKHKCDRCGAYHRAMYDYCPSCGIKMVEPQESEDKDADKKCTYKETGCGSCKRQLDCPIEADKAEGGDKE